MPDDELEAQVASRACSYVFLVDGVLQHLSCHAGQIALLARGEAPGA